MKRTLIVGGLAAALCAAIAPGAVASTLIPVSLEELSARAETIILATVAGREARFNDERTLILTDTNLRVDETLAGEPGVTLTVSEYGGCVGTTCTAIPELPRFEPGERVLLFVCRDALALPRTCGARQGKLHLRTAEDGTTWAIGEVGGDRVERPIDELRSRILAVRERGR